MRSMGERGGAGRPEARGSSRRAGLGRPAEVLAATGYSRKVRPPGCGPREGEQGGEVGQELSGSGHAGCFVGSKGGRPLVLAVSSPAEEDGVVRPRQSQHRYSQSKGTNWRKIEGEV